MFVDTSGRRWSSDKITTRPFGSVYFSNLIAGRLDTGALAVDDSGFTGTFLVESFLAGFCPETVTATTAAERPISNKRLKKAQVISILLGEYPLPHKTQQVRIRLTKSSKDYTIIPTPFPAGNPLMFRPPIAGHLARGASADTKRRSPGIPWERQSPDWRSQVSKHWPSGTRLSRRACTTARNQLILSLHRFAQRRVKIFWGTALDEFRSRNQNQSQLAGVREKHAAHD